MRNPNVVFLIKDHGKNINPDKQFLYKLAEKENYPILKAFSNKQGILISPDKIKNKYKPDIIVNGSHSETLRGFFKNLSCMKVMIAVDVYKLMKSSRKDWYKDNKFDLVFHRHFLDNNEKSIFNSFSCWFPYSADVTEFYPLNINKKINTIGFVGSYKAAIYQQRKKAISLLNKENLIDYNKKRIPYKKSADFYRKYIATLNTNELNSPYNRVFRSMATKSLVLTPKFRGVNTLFGDKPPIIIYKDSCSNITERAKKLLSLPLDEKEEITSKAYKLLIKYHTDEHRINEFYENIFNLYYGKDLAKRWGM